MRTKKHRAMGVLLSAAYLWGYSPYFLWFMQFLIQYTALSIISIFRGLKSI